MVRDEKTVKKINFWCSARLPYWLYCSRLDEQHVCAFDTVYTDIHVYTHSVYYLPQVYGFYRFCSFLPFEKKIVQNPISRARTYGGNYCVIHFRNCCVIQFRCSSLSTANYGTNRFSWSSTQRSPVGIKLSNHHDHHVGSQIRTL